VCYFLGCGRSLLVAAGRGCIQMTARDMLKNE
jgi:hypothetical protein